jgi:CheY-like chemotaxis protein
MRPIDLNVPARPSADTFASFENLRVAIAEDDWLVGMALQDMLTEMGCTVVGAATEKSGALSLVHRQDVDVAILDYWLHDEAVDDVADVLSAKNIPFAVATGFGISEIAPRLRHAPVVTKPYILQDIADVLTHLMAQAQRPVMSAGPASAVAEQLAG